MKRYVVEIDHKVLVVDYLEMYNLLERATGVYEVGRDNISLTLREALSLSLPDESSSDPSSQVVK